MGYGMGSLSAGNKAAVRTVVLASADTLFRERLRQQLTAMRWQVREAGGGAEAMAQLETQGAEAMVLDNVLPDLEVGEFARQMRSRHPVMDLLWVEGGVEEAGARSPRRNELLQALRQARQDAREQGAAVEMAPRAGASAGVAQDSAADRLGPGGERARAALQVAALLFALTRPGVHGRPTADTAAGGRVRQRRSAMNLRLPNRRDLDRLGGRHRRGRRPSPRTCSNRRGRRSGRARSHCRRWWEKALRCWSWRGWCVWLRRARRRC